MIGDQSYTWLSVMIRLSRIHNEDDWQMFRFVSELTAVPDEILLGVHLSEALFTVSYGYFYAVKFSEIQF